MSGDKYYYDNSGLLTEKAAVQTSAGVGNAGNIVSLDSTGHLDNSLLPTGIGADTVVIVASEALAAGDLVSVWNNSGTPNVRKADAATAGKFADGFVLSSVLISGNATVYFDGNNSSVSGLVAGEVFLSTTAGQTTLTAPSASGNVVQRVGIVTSATNLNFQKSLPYVKA